MATQRKANAPSSKAPMRSRTVKKATRQVPYEPPRLTKFDKLEKLIVCGE